MNGRAYAPVIGRFLSADPFIPDLYNSQALNRYSYVYNNPLSYTDPSGFDPESPPSWGFCFGCEPGSPGRSDAQQPRRTFHPRPLRQGASFNSIPPSGMPSDFVQGAMGIGPCPEGATPGTSSGPCGPAVGAADEECRLYGTACREPPLGQVGLECVIPVLASFCVVASADPSFEAVNRPAGAVRSVVTTKVRQAGNADDVAAEIVASNGTRITGLTRHGVHRAIGDAASRAGVKPQAVLDALKNPKKIVEGIDRQGRPFQVFHGENARVVVNPQTGKIVSMNPLSATGAH